MSDKIVYLVTSGEYSDYGVHAVFSTKEKAEAFVDAIDWGMCSLSNYKPHINEYPLDCMDERFQDELKFFKVWMDRDGNTRKIEQPKPSTDDIALLPYREWSADSDTGNSFSSMWAKDESHAVKIANERRTRWIAEGMPK